MNAHKVLLLQVVQVHLLNHQAQAQEAVVQVAQAQHHQAQAQVAQVYHLVSQAQVAQVLAH